MSQRILVTGARGMVGRTLIEQLDQSKWIIAGPSRSELDLTDGAATTTFVASFQPDVIVHTAGRVGGIQANIAAPVEYLVQNIDIGRNVILAAHNAQVPCLLNLASSCVYPRGRYEALREEDILTGELEPTNEGYALAKIFALRLCQYLNRQSHIVSYKTMIPCNLYGPNDHFDPIVSHLVPAALRKVAEAQRDGCKTVEIWGDGTARREFMFAGDLAEAIVRALADFETVPEVMNIGLGHDFSVLDYYQVAAEVVGWTGEFIFNRNKPVGMQRKLVDVTRQTAWGWRPKTSLRDGLAATHQQLQQSETL